MRKEVPAEDAESLELRIKQLEEKIKLVKTKRRILEAMLATKENIDVFKKLFGEKVLRELAVDPVKLSAAINEALERKGIKEVDLEALTEPLKVMLPIIIKEPEKHTAEKPIEVSKEAKPRVKGLEIETVYGLLDGGFVQRWVEEVDRASREGRKIKIPPISPKYSGRIGYKNLLVVVYSTGLKKLRSAVDRKPVLRLAELVSKLRSTGILELSPINSGVGYLDEFLKVVKDGKEERVSDRTKIEIYEFHDVSGRVVRIGKAIVKDTGGKALKIMYKLVNIND